MEALITPSDISILARPCDADEAIAYKAIDEAIDLDLRYLAGDSNYKAIVESDDNTLINGGEYTDENGNARILGGIKKAIAYLAYSRIVKFGNSHPTRFGTIQYNDSYSSHAEIKERQMMAEDAYNIGVTYLKESINYLNSTVNHCRKMEINSKRMIFKVIGY